MSIIKLLKDKKPVIGEDCFLAENCVIIGDVIIGAHCSIWYNTVLRGDVNSILIGHSVNIQDNTTVHCTYKKHKTVIGNEVSIGHNAIVHGCTIKDKVLIGMGSIVMDGCIVESKSIIAAGAVLLENTHVKSNEIWAGVPAKKIGSVSAELNEDEIKRIANNYKFYSKWYKE